MNQARGLSKLGQELYQQFAKDPATSGDVELLLPLIDAEIKACLQTAERLMLSRLPLLVEALHPDPVNRVVPHQALARFTPTEAVTELATEACFSVNQAKTTFYFSPLVNGKSLKVTPLFSAAGDWFRTYTGPVHRPNSSMITQTLIKPLPKGVCYIAIAVDEDVTTLDGLQLYFSGLSPAKCQSLRHLEICGPKENYRIASLDELVDEKLGLSAIDKEFVYLHKLRRNLASELPENGVICLKALAQRNKNEHEWPPQLELLADQFPEVARANIVLLKCCLPEQFTPADFEEVTPICNVFPIWNAQRRLTQQLANTTIGLASEQEQFNAESFLCLDAVYSAPNAPYLPATAFPDAPETYELITTAEGEQMVEHINMLTENLLHHLSTLSLLDKAKLPQFKGTEESIQTIVKGMAALQKPLANRERRFSLKTKTDNPAHRAVFVSWWTSQASKLATTLPWANYQQLSPIINEANELSESTDYQEIVMLCSPFGGQLAASLRERQQQVISQYTHQA